MDNELVRNKNWFNRNWKWILPSILITILLLTVAITTTSKNDLTNITQAYAENSLFEKAIEKANSNKKVLERIGKIKTIDKLAILEGNTLYTDNNNSVELSVRVQGTKGNGKLDISAYKNGKEWKYKTISLRTKNPKEKIKILN